MSDGFAVDLDAVTRLADTLAAQQEAVAKVGGPIQQQVDHLDTGDPALDAETRALAAEVDGLFIRFADAFVAIANDLDITVDSYRLYDAEAAARYRELMSAQAATPPNPDTPAG
jgi:hypothetical protein